MTQVAFTDRPRHLPGSYLEQEDAAVCIYNEYHDGVVRLDELSLLIWKLCDGERSIAEIMRLLGDAFPEGGERVAQETGEAIAALLNSGALEISR